MKYTYFFIAVIGLCLFVGCNNPQEKENQETQTAEDTATETPDLKTQLLGEWRNVSLYVTMDTKHQDSASAVTDVPAGQWETVLGIKPIRTTYKEDGTYTSEYRDLQDSVINVTSGSWSIEGDSLVLEAEGQSTKYKTEINGDQATFTGFLDWDQDGEEDDLYSGVQKKY
ncbi:MAG: hypothetical protein AAFX87_05905 [Bacteroidota bacterium]